MQTMRPEIAEVVSGVVDAFGLGGRDDLELVDVGDMKLERPAVEITKPGDTVRAYRAGDDFYLSVGTIHLKLKN